MAPIAAGLTVLAATALSACASEVDRAMEAGCEGLAGLAEAYASGDRAEFDAASDYAQPRRVGFVEFRGRDLTDETVLLQDADKAATAYTTLYSAAYKRAWATDAEWQGLELTAKQQRDVDSGVEACEKY